MQVADVAADIEHAMAMLRVGRLTRADAIGEEVHQNDAGLAGLLERIYKGARSGAGAADEDPVAWAHDRDRFCRRNPAVTPVGFRRHMFTATYFVSRNSSSPSLPPSRPMPDCLTPPKGAPAFETIP